jgi:KipI family sensor histidine kinase inhibitor
MRSVGPEALLVEVEDAAQALDLATWARATDVSAEEVVPGAGTVLFDGVADPAAQATRLGAWEHGAAPPRGELVEVPVTYDGPDLAFVARAWGLGVEDAVAAHAQHEYVAAFCGFAPGFAYLAGLPEERAVPRLDSPRPRVPAGAVAVADRWCGIYPTASPGGWRLLGTTDVVLWDQAREQPAMLPPGTRVRFVPR